MLTIFKSLEIALIRLKVLYLHRANEAHEHVRKNQDSLSTFLSMRRIARIFNVVSVIFLGYASAVAVTPDAVNGTVSTSLPDGRTIVVRAYSPDIIRVENFGAGEAPSRTQAGQLGVAPFDGVVERTADEAVIRTTSGLSAIIDLKSGAVAFDVYTTPATKRLLYDSGVRSNDSGSVSLSLIPEGGGTFYGAGERGHSLKLNGDTLVMYNRQNYGYEGHDPRLRQMNITVPMFVSTEGYGVLFDDHAPATLVMSDPIVYSSEQESPVSYYFIYGGGTVAGVTEEYSRLTGRQDLPPFWALGYITSKYGYKSQQETVGVIDTLKREGFPVDGVVLDLYWFGKETDMGKLAWDTVSWPDHRGMLAGLKARGVNTVLISEPYINKKGAIDNYNLLAEGGMLTRDKDGNVHDVTTWVGDAGMFDVANPATRRWLRERYRALTDEGVGGWWGDLGEPEVHPETIVHSNGMTAREYHNVYGNEWSKIIYDMYREEYPGRRLMTMMRGGTAGLQRYSVFPWSTDVARTWGGLEPQVRIMLNSGLSGLGYMSHDVGGFAIVDTTRVTDSELYVRWLQLGTFSPVLRTHAQKMPEPYNYPDQRDIILDLVRERYRWLPYNYTLAYENASRGYPFVRPLNFADTSSAPDSVSDQYMWGEEVMVAPVTAQSATRRRVVFPAGVWIDYHHPEKSPVSGPSESVVDAPLDEIPLFVRSGSFIPQAMYPMDNVGDYDPSRYTVLYYPRGDGESRYTMYDDDRMSSESLRDGEYALIDFAGKVDGRHAAVRVVQSGYYEGMPDERKLTFVLPGIKSGDVASVKVDGKVCAVGKSEEGYATFVMRLRGDTPAVADITLRR